MMRERLTGFALIELLTVIGIVAILIAILMPTLRAANDQARMLQCQSNERQICTSLFNYAADYRGKFPPNSSALNNWWYDADRLGSYLKPAGVPAGQPGGPVYTCPNDPDAHLSYAMNVWASSKVDASVTSFNPPSASLWTTVRGNSSRLMLIAESFSWSGNSTLGWYSKQAIGAAGASAGARFGGGAGIVPPISKGRFGAVTSELCFMRHRKPLAEGVYTQPRGIINFGYADGHVESKSNHDLVTPAGNSSGDTLWSATDVIGP